MYCCEDIKFCIKKTHVKRNLKYIHTQNKTLIEL